MNKELVKAASSEYVKTYGETMLTFGKRHEEAIEAVVALVIAEALAEPKPLQKAAVTTRWSWDKMMPQMDRADVQMLMHDAMDFIIADRRRALTAKPPDPAVEAVKRELRWYGSSYAEDVDAAKIVATVRSADGAK